MIGAIGGMGSKFTNWNRKGREGQNDLNVSYVMAEGEGSWEAEAMDYGARESAGQCFCMNLLD